MKKILVIGATVLDIIVNIDHLPTTEEDQHIISQAMSLGGQAYNVSDIIRHFKIPYTLISPVGTGMYGKIVEDKLKEKGIISPIKIIDGDNGFCLCMVEASGERTFLSYHGVEYSFQKEWMKDIDLSEYDSVYISGLEIEEETGIRIVEFLEEFNDIYKPIIYFAPGPRIKIISKEKLKRIFSLHPLLHLNEEEAICFSKRPNVEEAMEFLYQCTNNTVIITMAEQGVSCMYDGSKILVPSKKANVVDTIGAGDAHMGAVIAGLKKGLSIEKVLQQANNVSRRVVEVQGANLLEDEFSSIIL